MAQFNFTAHDAKTGQNVNSTVQAADEKSAAHAIKSQGLTPIEISSGKTSGSTTKGNFLNRVRTKDKVVFARQLSTLINAGLPLVQSLQAVAHQTSNKILKDILAKIIVDVEGGSSFSDSLAKYPKVFNVVFVSLVAAGEASGTLDKTLERLSDQQEKDAEIMGKVRGALIYPAIVVVVMVAVVTFMLTAVLPHVQELYKGIPGARLPFITTFLLAISHIITKFWWLIFIMLAIGAYFLFRWGKTGPGKEFFDRSKLNAWPFNRLFRKVYMARFTRTAQSLVASGVPLLQMMDIVGKAVGNIPIQHSLEKAAERVKGGTALSTAITGDSNFLELVPNMIQIGEESGSLEVMLGKTADYYEKEVDNEIKTISTLIEPVLMIALGIAALIIVAAVLLPIYNLAGKFNVT